MRTTLNLDDDVLEAAKAVAARECKSLGEVVSAMLRRAVEAPTAASKERNGLPLFPVSSSARPVTPAVVKEILDETP